MYCTPHPTPICLPAYLPACRPADLPTYLPAYMPCLLAYLPACFTAYLPTFLPIWLLAHLSICFSDYNTNPHLVCFFITGQSQATFFSGSQSGLRAPKQAWLPQPSVSHAFQKSKTCQVSLGHNPGSGLQNRRGFRSPMLATPSRNRKHARFRWVTIRAPCSKTGVASATLC